jgi:hypothetical protein
MSDEPKHRTDYQDIWTFAIKTCIAAVVVVLAASWIIDDVTAAVSSAIDNLRYTIGSQKVGGAEFWAKVEKGLDDAAVSDLPADRKEKLLRDVRLIVSQYRPFVDALKDGLKDESTPGQR